MLVLSLYLNNMMGWVKKDRGIGYVELSLVCIDFVWFYDLYIVSLNNMMGW